MRVCLICEGCYPYVPGGVSSWIQMLCTHFKDIEFVIWSIATTEKEMSKICYQIPENVKEVRTFYLGEVQMSKKHRPVKLSGKDYNTLRGLITGKPESIDWKDTLEFIKHNRERLQDILMGYDFYQICLEEYNRQGSKKVFFHFLWNLRNMYFPLMYILSDEILEADVYHSVSTGYAGILGSCMSYVRNKPFVLTEHGIYTREREEDIIRAQWVEEGFKEIWINFFKKISNITYHQADVVTSLFQVNKTLQIELGCPEEKIQIIPNGVSVADFFNLPHKHLVPKDKFNIGAVVRVVPIKDIKTAIIAFADVKERIPEARFNIMGNCDENPDYYRECAQFVKELNIPDVVFLGQVNVKDYLPDVDVLLLSSISEGQPLAVLEGMAVGIPYVSTNVGDCQGLLTGNGTKDPAGIVVPVMNSGAMADAICYLYDHPEVRKQMGETGQKRVAQEYRKDVFLQEYRALYTKLGGERNGRNRI